MNINDIYRKVRSILDPNFVSDAELEAAKPVKVQWQISLDGELLDEFEGDENTPLMPWHLPYMSSYGYPYSNSFLTLTRKKD